MDALVVDRGDALAPMFAELLSRHLEPGVEPAERRHRIESAGYDPGAKGQIVTREWQVLVKETRVNLSGHRGRWIGDLNLVSYGVFYCLNAMALREVEKKNIDPIVEVNLVRIADPWQKGLDAYRGCFEEIFEAVLAIPPHR